MQRGVVCGSVVFAVLAGASAAQDVNVSSKSRLQLFENQTRILDERATTQYANSSRLLPDSVRNIARGIGPEYSGSYRGQYYQLARAAARRHGVPEDLFLRLVQQESNWNAAAVSHKGAVGLAQLMPATARMLGVNPRDPIQNLDGGARYLRAQYERFRDWRLALAAYNAGPEAVERHDGIPPFAETKTYVRRIWGS